LPSKDAIGRCTIFGILVDFRRDETKAELDWTCSFNERSLTMTKLLIVGGFQVTCDR
jgi:hypothetical protein